VKKAEAAADADEKAVAARAAATLKVVGKFPSVPRCKGTAQVKERLSEDARAAGKNAGNIKMRIFGHFC